MINDTVKMTGAPTLTLRDQHGNVKLQFTTKNLVVTTGKNLMASRLTGNATSVATHMAIGTSAATPAGGQTTLGTETGRVALTVSGGVAVDNVVTYTASFGPGVGTGAVTELGIFNDATTGLMLARVAFSVVNKDALDTLSVDWAITIA